MPKITLRLDTRRERKDGTFPLKVAIHRNGRTLYLPLDFSLRADEWCRQRQEVVKRADRRSINILLQERISLLNAEMLKLQLSGTLRTLTDRQLLSVLSGECDKLAPLLFKDYFAQFIASVANKRTRAIYEATAKRVAKFSDHYDQLTFGEITPSWLKAFDADMAAKGNKVNTRSIHMRNLRALFNSALDDELIDAYPFRRFKIKSQQTAKRALSREQLLALWNAPVQDYQRKYVDMFFIGFFLIGINVVDMAQLESVDNGRVTYERSKTHKLYSIKVEPEALQLMEKHKGESGLLSFFDNCANYRSVANRQNYNLTKIGKQLGIEKLTYYCCRHTWATFASELDISDDVIAMALGHSRSTVTDVYIRRNRAKVDAANRAVIDYLFQSSDEIGANDKK